MRLDEAVAAVAPLRRSIAADGTARRQRDAAALCTSVVDGSPVTGVRHGRRAPTRRGSTRSSPRSRSADAGTFVGAAEAAQGRAAGVGGRARAGARPGDRAHRPAGRGQRRGAGPRWSPREIGKPYAEALGEVQEIVDTCDFFLGEGRRLYGQTVPSEMPDKQLFTFRKPVGAVAVITAGNFPVAVPSWYIVPALLCGNAVVWKPAEYSAVVSARASTSCSSAAAGCPTACSTSCTPTARPRSPGWSRRWTPGLIDKVGFTGSSAVGARDRRAHRPAPADGLPGAGRQEPAGRHAERRPRPGRGGRAVLRLRHRRAALHLARHGDRARVGARRVPRAGSTAAVAAAAGRRPDPGRADAGRCSTRSSPSATRSTSAGSSRTTRCSARRHRPDHRRQPAGRLRRRPGGGLFYHPVDRRRRAPGRRALHGGDVRPDRRRDDVPDAGRGDRAGQRARLRAVRRRSTPPTRRRRSRSGDGIGAGMVSRQQLDLRRRGAPAVRRQRQVRQRLAASPGIWVLDQFTRWQSMNWDYSGRLQKAQMDVVELTPDTHLPPLTADAMPSMPACDTARSTALRRGPGAQLRRGPELSGSRPLGDARRPVGGPAGGELFEAQATSRHLDFAARELQQQGGGFYTIGSAGHESNAAGRRGAAADRPGAAALPVGRLLLWPGPSRCRARRRSATCCRACSGLADEPIAGGRHKVFGHPDLAIIPQTSTIASHLPRAVGLARRAAPGPTGWASTSRVAARRRRGLLVRRRLGQPLHRRRRDQHRAATPPSAGCRCRSCSSARTTASASRCRPRTAGSSPRTGPAPGCDYLAADGADPVAARPLIVEAVSRGRDANAGRSSCTCAPSGSSATPAATPRSATARRAAIEADYARDPLLGTAPRPGAARARPGRPGR